MEKVYASFSHIVLSCLLSRIDRTEKSLKNISNLSSTRITIVWKFSHDAVHQLRHALSLSLGGQLRQWLCPRVLKHVTVLERQKISRGKLVNQLTKIPRTDWKEFVLSSTVSLPAQRYCGSLHNRIISQNVKMGVFFYHERWSHAFRLLIHSQKL